MTDQDRLIQYQELALGSRLKRLSDHMMKEAVKTYKALAIDFDPYHMPIFKLISEQDNLSIGEISKSLNVTQPAVTQYINSLGQKKLIISKTGKNDKRKKKISLSKQGKMMLLKLIPIWNIFDQELKILSSNTKNKTLLEHISFIEKELKAESLSSKILSKSKLINRADKLKIISFKEEYTNHFRDLNIEWLEKYFYIEKHDEEVLNNAKRYIIDKGGYIFFALYKGEVAGTLALMNEEEGYELSKMAVSPKFQGLKIGQQLMQYSIHFARNKGWSKLLLYSNTILENAIYIYKKYGFEEVNLETDNPYNRSDIKMILKL
ncbi:MAG: bifunctional helix-turn-helix transcriptional regulator/GNAT family N-acetyltransferase [Flavobacteriaceae bacterium]|nr:bifunctional helix-turn-helix transcriptional regulator/GNAT family N-acetyltransferase [Flavobacteriaceae bacterium]